MTAAHSERAWAKINLGLKVLGPRGDGYHNICSVFLTVDLADDLHFRQVGASNRLISSDVMLPVDDGNLVIKALKLFQQEVGNEGPIEIRLKKKIPVGAGLGGGSADAAAVLRGMSHLHCGRFDPDWLRTLGSRLGSDVPFLVNGGCALVRGRGEEITPMVPKGDLFFVLSYPGVHIRTSWAYAHIEPSLTVPSVYLKFCNSLSGGCVELWDLCSRLENDFQPIVERAYPIVADLGKKLSDAGAIFRSMSGSGSCIFGVFEDRSVAWSAANELQAEGFRSFLCQPVNPSLI